MDMDFVEDTSLIIPELRSKSDILEHNHVRELSRFLPARAEGYAWSLSFATSTMGFSLKSLYRNLAKYDGPVLLIIKDTQDVVFGAFCSCSLQPSETFYGTGETYLFSFKQPKSKLMQSSSSSSTPLPYEPNFPILPPPPDSSPQLLDSWLKQKETQQETYRSIDANSNATTQFRRYPWTGDNLYFIKGNQDSIVFGAGDGTFGLWLDGDLYHGSTHPCKTFNNEQLTINEDFVVSTLECWCFYISN